jgi:nucleotide-binding universal stress UspA family protein
MVFKKILWPTDFSQASLKVLPYLELFKEKLDIEVQVVHILRDLADYYAPFLSDPVFYLRLDEKTTKDAKESLKKTVDTLKNMGIRVKGTLIRGTPYIEIVRFAEKEDMDLIVMGSKGLTGFEHLLLGSVAEKVTRKSSIPVLTVREEVKKVEVKRILFPTDLSETSYVAFDLALSLAELFDSEIHMLHVLELLSGEKMKAEALLEDTQFEDMAVSIKRVMKEEKRISILKHVIRGFDAGYSIPEFADEIDADIIVMATHGRSGLSHVLLGSVTEKVMKLSSKPLLTIKPPHLRK